MLSFKPMVVYVGPFIVKSSIFIEPITAGCVNWPIIIIQIVVVLFPTMLIIGLFYDSLIGRYALAVLNYIFR